MFRLLRNIKSKSPSKGKRSELNLCDDACNISKEEIREALYKQLRATCNTIILGELKYRKIDSDCWQCEQNGVNYSDNIMNMITEDFEKDYNIIAIYE